MAKQAVKRRRGLDGLVEAADADDLSGENRLGRGHRLSDDGFVDEPARVQTVVKAALCEELGVSAFLDDAAAIQNEDAVGALHRRKPMRASRRIARAIATRWRCPTERRTPRSPTIVSMPLGIRPMNSVAFADRAASSISASVASSRP